MAETYDIAVTPQGVTLTLIGKAGATSVDYPIRQAKDLAAELLSATADAEQLAKQELEQMA